MLACHEYVRVSPISPFCWMYATLPFQIRPLRLRYFHQVVGPGYPTTLRLAAHASRRDCHSPLLATRNGIGAGFAPAHQAGQKLFDMPRSYCSYLLASVHLRAHCTHPNYPFLYPSALLGAVSPASTSFHLHRAQLPRSFPALHFWAPAPQQRRGHPQLPRSFCGSAAHHQLLCSSQGHACSPQLLCSSHGSAVTPQLPPSFHGSAVLLLTPS